MKWVDFADCVSAQDKNLDRQILAMEKHGIKEKNIFLEKASGKDFQRPVFQEMLRKLKKGDTLTLTALDRLGRNYLEILEFWRILTKEKGVENNKFNPFRPDCPVLFAFSVQKNIEFVNNTICGHRKFKNFYPKPELVTLRHCGRTRIEGNILLGSVAGCSLSA